MRNLKNWIRLIKGLVVFSLTGKRQERAYQAMVGLFCTTGGRSNDVISSVIRFLRPKANFSLNVEEKKTDGKLGGNFGKRRYRTPWKLSHKGGLRRLGALGANNSGRA